MGNRYLLGVDVGTTSIKVAIIDEQARVLGMSSSSYRLITPNQDYAQIYTEDMWRAYLKCIRLLQEGKNIDMSRVAGISISSLCPGLAALGENGEVLTDPIIYSDRRNTEEAEMILEAVGREKLFESRRTQPWQVPCREPQCCGSSGTCRKFMRKQNISVM